MRTSLAFDVVSILNLFFYFKRTLVVVIGGKLFAFSGEKETALTVSVSAWIWNSKYFLWYTGDTLWMYPANVSECDRFSAIAVERNNGEYED